jgi:hypothetical protein
LECRNKHTNLIVFGAIQLLGGVLLVLLKTRIVGAFLVAITFFASLIVLVMAGNLPVAAITLICIVLLGSIFKQSAKAKNADTLTNLS